MRILRPDDPAPGSKYAHYKFHLRSLFRARCAYCHTHDHRVGGIEAMTVDHFLPRNRYESLLHTWSNLYYSCTPCNCYYKKDRPSAEEEALGYRLVDPCLEDPDDHFCLARCPNTNQLCLIKALSDSGRFSLKVLKLHVRPQLRDLWRELEMAEIKEREQLDSIDSMVLKGLIHIEKNGLSPEFKSIMDGLEQLRIASIERLEDILKQRPFPAEI